MPHNGRPAFRCKTCGHVESAEHAGENPVPAACSVCGEGVQFNARGVKSANPDNWEVLADAEPKRLKELGLEPEKIARHAPAPPREKMDVPPEGHEGVVSIPGRHVTATATEGVRGEDRAG